MKRGRAYFAHHSVAIQFIERCYDAGYVGKLENVYKGWKVSW